MKNKPKTASRTTDASAIWNNQPRDSNGRWVQGGTTLSVIIKNKATREKYKKQLKKSSNESLSTASLGSSSSAKPLKISKNKLKDALALNIGKKEAAKLDKDFNEVYKPSLEVAEKLKSKTASPRGVDKLIDKEAHQPYMKVAKAHLISEGEDSSPKAVKERAYDYALSARIREYEKIKQVTKDEYQFKTKKGEVELDTEDTYQATWVNQYKVKDSNGKIINKGLFRTAEELRDILRD